MHDGTGRINPLFPRFPNRRSPRNRQSRFAAGTAAALITILKNGWEFVDRRRVSRRMTFLSYLSAVNRLEKGALTPSTSISADRCGKKDDQVGERTILPERLDDSKHSLRDRANLHIPTTCR